MFASWINANDVAQRIDPEHHNPDLLAMKRRVQEAFASSSVRKECLRMNSGPFGSALLSSAYVEAAQGVLFVRPQDCKDLIVNDDNENVYISHQDNSRLSSSSFPSGAIVVTKIGNGIGDMAVVPSHIQGCNISGNAMGVVLGRHDPYFAISYLRGRYGQAEVARGLSGGPKPKIDMESVGAIVFPLVNAIAQKYIGGKVRQAEYLIERAKVLGRVPVIIESLLSGLINESELIAAQKSLDEGDHDLDLEILSKLHSPDHVDERNEVTLEIIRKCKLESVDNERENCHINRIEPSEIEDFLTAQTYRPEITQAYDSVIEFDYARLQDVCVQPIRQGATPKFSEQGFKCLKSKQTREMIIDDVGFEIVDPSDPENSSIVRLVRGDVVITRQGSGTVGRASLFLDDVETYVTDSLFVVRVDDNKVDPGYLVAYLRSYTGKRLIEKGVYGSTGQLNLSASHVRNLPIVNLNPLSQKYLGDKVRLVNRIRACHRSLVRGSKCIVEALIEGHLTKQQLIDAQKALDADDNSLDRDILSRLKTDGIDGEGEPLFPDLDQLYELLERANQELEA